jgi:hypothetical protein
MNELKIESEIKGKNINKFYFKIFYMRWKICFTKYFYYINKCNFLKKLSNNYK